ncbi:MAG TPA: geranylgeranyl reductase family protein [Saprospiraceae bacterium]|nr:geranylgeranyl reductase family protein [Saprospiraceae bacterium]HMP26245.1 geranylgeranyl reductase family protein [Saprospiraceae bacterium]
MQQTDICILGAGPGGAATALKLSYLGIPCTLIDKATFPRDKICGDAISSKVLTLLGRLDPAMLQRFDDSLPVQRVNSITFIAPNLREVCIPFQPMPNQNAANAPGYVARRLDFDHFLIEEVKKRNNIRLYENVAIEQFEKRPDGFWLSDKTGKWQWRTRLLIDASGAQSPFSRRIAGLAKDPRHHAGAVRAYYQKVEGLRPDTIELHFIKSIVPGYFWIFPLPDGSANVGLGLRTDVLSRRKVNLRKLLPALLTTHPGLRERFAHAELEGAIRGFPLPLGSKTRPISGDHYMLVGDAGHLIDPLTGEGIGNAFYSGIIAAELAEQCLLQNNFSATFMRSYDRRVQRVLGSEMRWSYRLQLMLAYPRIANLLANTIAGNAYFVRFCSELMEDLGHLKRLFKPAFWWRAVRHLRKAKSK